MIVLKKFDRQCLRSRTNKLLQIEHNNKNMREIRNLINVDQGRNKNKKQKKYVKKDRNFVKSTINKQETSQIYQENEYDNTNQKQESQSEGSVFSTKESNNQQKYQIQDVDQNQRKQMLSNIIQKCQKVFMQVGPQAKYFSRNIYGKINERKTETLSLSQDQKKSLQSNLIYSLFKFIGWQKIVSFFKRNRNKVKQLKISTIQQSVLNGRIFKFQKNKEELQVNNLMIFQAVQKLQNVQKLHHKIFQKKAYIKIYKKDPNLFEERMILIAFKLMQFCQLLNRKYRSLNINEIQGKQQSLKMTDYFLYEDLYPSDDKIPITKNIDSTTSPLQEQAGQLRLESLLQSPESSLEYSLRIQEQELTVYSIFNPDMKPDIDSQYMSAIQIFQSDI